MRNAILSLLTLMTLSSAGAVTRSAGSELKSMVEGVRQNCQTQICSRGFDYRLIQNGAQGTLPPNVAQALSVAAKTQAQIWADTILEGDYSAKGDTRLDQVYVISRGGRVLGYRIVYSETARSPEGLGRIAEAAWVHIDLRTSMTDEQQYAEFYR